MNGDPEIKDLLREIRDLQKAHFERYREFTDRITQAEAVNRERQEAFLRETRRSARMIRVFGTVLAVFGIIIIILGIWLGLRVFWLAAARAALSMQ